MISLVFLVCNTVYGNCYFVATEAPFATKDACQNAALDILAQNTKLQQEGKMPPERATYRCINWGEPV